MIENQNIPTELLLWAMDEKKQVLLRDYLIFRAANFNSGSYGRKPDRITWSSMKRLIDAGWVVRVRQGWYRFNSVYKISLSLGLNISLRSKVSTKELLQGSRNWKGYLMGVGESYLISRKKFVSRKAVNRIDRDGVKNRGDANRDKGELLATRYIEQAFGISPSTVSSYRKLGFNDYHAQYDIGFDQLNIKRKKDLVNFLEELRYSDLAEHEKDALRNIEWSHRFKKYRVRTATKVIPKCGSIGYSSCTKKYKLKYNTSPKEDCVGSLPNPL